MPTLKCKTETVFQVDYNDFNDFVNEVYGFEPVKPYPSASYTEPAYNFQQVEESSNDVSHQFEVPSSWSDPSEVSDDIAAWVESNGTSNYISAYAILEDLINKGHINPGTYIINVSW